MGTVSHCSVVKKGCHAGEQVYFDSRAGTTGAFGKARSHAVLEEIRVASERRESRVMGTAAHCRRKRGEYFDDQAAAANTATVTGFVDGMGLRIERRQSGYSWSGEGDGRGGKRGRIKGFSASSAARLRDRIWQMRRSVVPVMVTLTYMEMPDIEKVKRDLDVFLKALKKKYPKASGIWKLEPTKRGVPHFHLLVWGAKPWMGWVAKTWYRIVGTGDARHLAAGTRVEALRSYRGTLAYAGKRYMSKVVDGGGYEWGRFWGVFAREKLPMAVAINERIPGRLGMWIARTVRRWMRARSKGKCRGGARGRVVWITTDYPQRWLDCFDYLDGLAVEPSSSLIEWPF